MRCVNCGSTDNRIGVRVVCGKECLASMVTAAQDAAALRGYHSSVIVTGGRDYNGTVVTKMWLIAMLVLLGASEVVHGDAYGADKWCGFTAASIGLSVKAHPADWDEHGKAAGAIRNAEMLRETKNITGVLAFPGGRGTENMLKQAVIRPYGSEWYPVICSNGVVL